MKLSARHRLDAARLKGIDDDRLAEAIVRVADEIDAGLLTQLKAPIRTGRLGGEPLPFRPHLRQREFFDSPPPYAFYGGCRER